MSESALNFCNDDSIVVERRRATALEADQPIIFTYQASAEAAAAEPKPSSSPVWNACNTLAEQSGHRY